jgi:hypothetical protein
MNSALDKQGKIVGEYIERTDEAQKDLSAHNVAMEKGLASVEGELSELRSLPANLKDLEGAAHRIDETTTSFDARLGDLRARLSALDAKLDTLLARPACPTPTLSPPAKTAGSAAKTDSARAQSPTSAPTADGGKTGT